MRLLAVALLILAALPARADDKGDSDSSYWFRSAGEYIAFRSVRMDFPTDTSTKLITDGKRIDVGLGDRIPLFSWGEKDRAEGMVIGIDGGMLASLTRYSAGGRLTFATNTFDGFFGAFIADAFDGWLFMFRTAHLSAHLVDNSPQISNAIGYSQFWNQLTVGKEFPDPKVKSEWNLNFQGSIGLNNTSGPPANNPRAAAGADFGYSFFGFDSFGAVASADLLRAGVQGQRPDYSFFLGYGTIDRPQTTHRPFRIGAAAFTGTDYRNQLFMFQQKFFALEMAAAF